MYILTLIGVFAICFSVYRIIFVMIERHYKNKEKKERLQYPEFYHAITIIKKHQSGVFRAIQQQNKIKELIDKNLVELKYFPQEPPYDTDYRMLHAKLKELRYQYLCAQGSIDSAGRDLKECREKYKTVDRPPNSEDWFRD